MAATKTLSPNLAAFLDAIAYSELGAALLAVSDNGYDVIVGSTARAPYLMKSYSDHPRTMVWLASLNINSSAAGRYQLLARYWDVYRHQLGLTDFSPESQDAVAIQQIRERKALGLIESGDFAAAVDRVSNLWASLPGATYGQHVNRMADLEKAYQAAGGRVA